MKEVNINLEISWLYVLEYKDKFICVIADANLDQDIEAVTACYDLPVPINMESYGLNDLDYIKKKHNTKPSELLF